MRYNYHSSPEGKRATESPYGIRRHFRPPGNFELDLRVLYGIDDENREVQIQAIGVKEGNRLLVAGREVEL